MAIVLIEGFESAPYYGAPTSAGGQVMDAGLGSGRDLVGQSIRGSNGGGSSNVDMPFVAGSDEIYVHCGYQAKSNNTSTQNDYSWCQFWADSGTIQHITLNIDLTWHITVRRGSSTGPILATSAQALVPGVWYSVEMKVKVHDTTGTVVIKVDGVEWINFVGDTRNLGASTRIDMVRLNARGDNQRHDDWLIQDTTGVANNSWPGEVSIVGLRPSGNGASSQLIGSDTNSVDNYMLVDELVPASADYVGSVTNLAKDTYAFTDITKVGAVLAVKPAVQVWKSDAGTKGFDFVTRSAGGAELITHGPPISTTIQFMNGPILETDADGNPWTVARVNSAEFGVRVTDAA